MTLAETCGCGAAIAIESRYETEVTAAVKAFHAQHATCRVTGTRARQCRPVTITTVHRAAS